VYALAQEAIDMYLKRAGGVIWLWVVAWALMLNASSARAMTGSQWNAFGETARVAHVDGFVDGVIMIATLADQPPEVQSKGLKNLEMVASCVIKRDMPRGQIVAMADKYMKEHPGQRDQMRMSLVILEVLTAECRGQ